MGPNAGENADLKTIRAIRGVGKKAIGGTSMGALEVWDACIHSDSE
jgi:hypothetical protein